MGVVNDLQGTFGPPIVKVIGGVFSHLENVTGNTCNGPTVAINAPFLYIGIEQDELLTNDIVYKQQPGFAVSIVQDACIKTLAQHASGGKFWDVPVLITRLFEDSSFAHEDSRNDNNMMLKKALIFFMMKILCYN